LREGLSFLTEVLKNIVLYKNEENNILEQFRVNKEATGKKLE